MNETMNDFLYSVPLWVWVILFFWEITWKSIAMWHAARRNQLAWFILIIVFNTIGILPIMYLLMNRKRLTRRSF